MPRVRVVNQGVGILESEALVRVDVARLALDRTTNTPVVFLREAVGDRGVAIWIGPAEARAIALALAGDTAPRPLTHDLLHTLLGALQGTVERVNITAVRDGTYLAELHLLRSDGQQVTIDARPSDALALALRADAPVWAHSSLLQADGVPAQEVVAPLDAEALRAHLRGLGPEDFGRFTP